jgi:hypothetical protein
MGWYKRWGLLVLVVAPIASFVGNPGAADAAPPATMPAGTQVIDLRFVEDSGPSRISYGFWFDREGQCYAPFANAAGKLTLQLKGDKLQADTNGDGVIDKKDAPPFTPKDVTIKVAAKIAGKPVEYPLFIGGVEGNADSNRYVVLSPRGMLEGKLGGDTIRILDRGTFGRFGEASDMQWIGTSSAGAGLELPWSRTIDLNGSLYQIEMLGEGAQLKVTPYTGPVAEVTLQSEDQHLLVSATLVAQDGSQVSSIAAGQTRRLVPAKYQVNCTLQAPPQGESISNLIAQPSDRARLLEAKPGQNVLKVGAPFTLEFTAIRKGDQIELTEAALLGCSGESYRPSLHKNKDVFAAYVRAGDKETKLADLGFS